MNKKKSGMSMVEIMIGVILLALIIVPSLNVIVSQTRTVTATRDHAQAAMLAQKIQEICRSYKFNLISAAPYTNDISMQQRTFEWRLKNLDEMNKYLINGVEYRVDPASIKIAAAENANETEQIPILYMLSFSIDYTGKDNRSHRLDIATAIAKRE